MNYVNPALQVRAEALWQQMNQIYLGRKVNKGRKATQYFFISLPSKLHLKIHLKRQNPTLESIQLVQFSQTPGKQPWPHKLIDTKPKQLVQENP